VAQCLRSLAASPRLGRLATVTGVIAATTGVQVAGRIALVGNPIVAAVLLTGIGAVVVSYFGVTRFRPAPLPDRHPPGNLIDLGPVSGLREHLGGPSALVSHIRSKAWWKSLDAKAGIS
jgi:hypothetical protein